MQSEVMESFNHELDKANMDSPTGTIDPKMTQRAQRKLKKRAERSSSQMRTSLHMSMTRRFDITNTKSQFSQTPIQPSRIGDENTITTDYSESTIDIDLLEKIDDKINQVNIGGVSKNAKVLERIRQDRALRMSESELQSCLEMLRGTYGGRTAMYEQITLALHKNDAARKILQKNLITRTKRLQFLNTLTDPQHLFGFLLKFYKNKRQLAEDIQELLSSQNIHLMKKIIHWCGERYRVEEYLLEFVATKELAVKMFQDKIPDARECFIMIDKCLRHGPSDSVVVNLFMSSENDADRFFECIYLCNTSEMMDIHKELKRVEEIHRQFDITEFQTHLPTSDQQEEPDWIDNIVPTVDPVEVNIMTQDLKNLLPPLPIYDENSWKIMMAQYLSQMLTTIMPRTSNKSGGSSVNFIENKSIQKLLIELGFLHTEVLRLLNVYLNNEDVSARKLLRGLVMEDRLAIEALMELIGEKEALRIVKSLKLKQANLIEKILEMSGDEAEVEEARAILRSMMQYLPGGLSAHMHTWLLTEDDAIHRDAKPMPPEGSELLISTNRIYIPVDLPEMKEPLLSNFFDGLEGSQVDNSMDSSRRRFSVFDMHLESMVKRYSYQESTLLKKPMGKTVRMPVLQMSVELSGTPLGLQYRDMPERDERDDMFDKDSTYTELPDWETEKFNEKDQKTLIASLSDSSQQTSSSIVPDVRDAHPLTVDPLLSNTDEEMFCQDVCREYTMDPVTTYNDLVWNLAEMVVSSEDFDHTLKIATTMVDVINNRIMEPQNAEALVDLLMGEIVLLMEERDQDQEALLRRFAVPLQPAAVTLPSRIPGPLDGSQHKSSPALSATASISNFHEHLSETERVTFEAAVKQSHFKQLRIEQMITILTSLESSKAKKLKEIYDAKREMMSLFVPESMAQLTAMKKMGLRADQPFEVVNAKPDIIMRNKEEERFRQQFAASSSIPKILRRYSTDSYLQHKSVDTPPLTDKVPRLYAVDVAFSSGIRKNQRQFWERSEITTGIPLISYQLKRIDRTTTLSGEDTTSTPNLLQYGGQMTLNTSPGHHKLSHQMYAQPVIEQIRFPEDEVTHLTASQMLDKRGYNLRPAVEDSTPKEYKTTEETGNLFVPEEEILIKPERGLTYESQEAAEFTVGSSRRKRLIRKPKDPYNDFHLLYGPNSYYLPFINPNVVHKKRSREDSLPAYENEPSSSKTGLVYRQLNRMVKGLGTEKKRATGIFSKAKFVARPSGVPLQDWVKIGAPGMAGNLTVLPQPRPQPTPMTRYKASDHRGGSHHVLSHMHRPRLDMPTMRQYGLSPAKMDHRNQLVDFISKANAATLSENVRERLMTNSMRDTQSRSSSGSLLSSH